MMHAQLSNAFTRKEKKQSGVIDKLQSDGQLQQSFSNELVILFRNNNTLYFDAFETFTLHLQQICPGYKFHQVTVCSLRSNDT